MKNTIEKPDANLDRWLGRREAFGLIAGRCSAAEVESLRRIRTEKLYRERDWERSSRRYRACPPDPRRPGSGSQMPG